MDLFAPVLSVFPLLWLSLVLSLDDLPVLVPVVFPSLTELLCETLSDCDLEKLSDELFETLWDVLSDVPCVLLFDRLFESLYERL